MVAFHGKKKDCQGNWPTFLVRSTGVKNCSWHNAAFVAQNGSIGTEWVGWRPDMATASNSLHKSIAQATALTFAR